MKVKGSGMCRARAVVADGIRYETISAAAMAIDVVPNYLAICLRKGKTVCHGARVAYASDVAEVVDAWKRPRVPGEPLLAKGHATRRLGTYREQRV